jgi:hypothetical protein
MQKMEEIYNKNGRIVSPIVGYPVASERMLHLGRPEQRWKAQERLKDQGERDLMSPNLNFL